MVLSEYHPPQHLHFILQKTLQVHPPAVKVISFHVDFGYLHVSIKIRHRSASMENITPSELLEFHDSMHQYMPYL